MLYVARNRTKSTSTYLGAARVLEIPKLDVPVADGDEVVAVLRETNGLHLARNFVRRHFNVVPPVPDVDDHVVLRAHGHHVLVARRKCLEKRKQGMYSVYRACSSSSSFDHDRSPKKRRIRARFISRVPKVSSGHNWSQEVPIIKMNQHSRTKNRRMLIDSSTFFAFEIDRY